MKRAIPFFSFFFLFSIVINAQTIIPGGSVSGLWEFDNSPFQVQGSILIEDGETLTIEPGVTVEFDSSYKFLVLGQLLAVGDYFDSISFTAADTLVGWLGIQFDNTLSTNDTSRISFCNIEYAIKPYSYDFSGAIYLDYFSKVVISNCRIANNSGYIGSSHGGGICCEHAADPIIRDNWICYNQASYGGGIYTGSACDPKIINNLIEYNVASKGAGIWVDGGDPSIRSNIISYNSSISTSDHGAGGIALDWYSDPVISNNLISFNTATGNGAAMTMFGSNPLITNNTMTSNSSGIYCSGNSDPVFYNTILYGNTDNEVYLATEDSDPDFYYCNVEGGTGDFVLNGNFYTGTYENNIEEDPQYLDVADFHLSETSPVLDAGSNSFALTEVDLDGNPRLVDGDGDGSLVVDMGAYEFQDAPLLTSLFVGTDSLCQNDDATFMYAGNGSPQAGYFWDFDGGEILNGSGQGPYEIHWDESGSKTVSLYVVDDGVHSDTSYHNIEVLEATEVLLSIVSTGNVICAGETIIFTALPVNGGDNPVYEWKHNEQTVGTNSQVYTTSNLQNGDVIYCRLHSSIVCSSVQWALSNEIGVEVYEYPEVSIVASPNDTVGVEQVIILDAGAGADFYLWSTGETTQSIVVSNSSGPAGGMQEYAVMATNGNSCSAYDTLSVYFEILDNTAELVDESAVYVFPNPASEDVFVQMPRDAKNVVVSLFSVQGTLYQTIKIDKIIASTPVKIELPAHLSGIYLMHITTEKSTRIFKILVN